MTSCWKVVVAIGLGLCALFFLVAAVIAARVIRIWRWAIGTMLGREEEEDLKGRQDARPHVHVEKDDDTE